MKVWALADRSYRWGEMLVQAACTRGHQGQLFRQAAEITRMPREPGEVAFLRIAQWPPNWQRDRQVLADLARADVPTIPDLDTGRLYEDKLAQARAWSDWLPDTRIITGGESQAAHALEALGLPLISKAQQEAGSHGVRLLRTREEAMREARAVFHGAGIRTRRGVQRGYLLWQRFLPENPYDYRVIIAGRLRLVLRRHNRPGTVFASGSGRADPIRAGVLDSPAGVEVMDAVTEANRFAEAIGARWIAVDLVRDHQAGRWRILEGATAWELSGYFSCELLGPALEGSGRYGYEFWPAVVEEIEAGALP